MGIGSGAASAAEPEPAIIDMDGPEPDAPTELRLTSGTRKVAPHCGHLAARPPVGPGNESCDRWGKRSG